MAVNLDDDFKYRYSIFFETVDPADDARVQAGKDWIRAEAIAHFDKARFDKARDPYQLDFNKADRPWRAEFLPRKLKIKKGNKLPDFVVSFPGCNNKYAKANMVSPRLKALIESHQTDKDGWQFFSVEILNSDGSTHGTYYIWWVHKVVDALDESSEGLKSVGGGPLCRKTDFGNYAGEKSPERQRLHKSEIDGLTAWIDYRFFPSARIFVSDVLYQAMQDAEISNIGFHSIWSEV